MWPHLQFPADLSHLLKKFLMENYIFCAVLEKTVFLLKSFSESSGRKEVFTRK